MHAFLAGLKKQRDVRRSFERRNFPPAQLFLCTVSGA